MGYPSCVSPVVGVAVGSRAIVALGVAPGMAVLSPVLSAAVRAHALLPLLKPITSVAEPTEVGTEHACGIGEGGRHIFTLWWRVPQLPTVRAQDVCTSGGSTESAPKGGVVCVGRDGHRANFLEMFKRSVVVVGAKRVSIRRSVGRRDLHSIWILRRTLLGVARRRLLSRSQ